MPVSTSDQCLPTHFFLQDVSNGLQISLRKIGFRHDVFYIQETLNAIQLLRNEIQAIKLKFPGMSDLMFAFNNLQENLIDEIRQNKIKSSTTNIILPILNTKKIANERWCSVALIIVLQRIGSVNSANERILLALFWVSSNWFYALSSNTESAEKHSCEVLIELLDLIQSSRKDKVHEIQIEENFSDLIVNLKKEIDQSISKATEKAKFKRFESTIDNILIFLANPPSALDSSCKVAEEIWGNRGGDVLTERELLPEHWTVATEQEYKIINETLNKFKPSSKVDHTHSERFVCLIAMITGKTPSQALQINVCVKPSVKNLVQSSDGDYQYEFSEECLIIRPENSSGSANTRSINWRWRITWFRPLNKNHRAFSYILSDDITVEIMPFILTHRSIQIKLIDLLPWSFYPWRQRIASWLLVNTKIPVGRCRIIFRRTLALNLYHQDASRAMLSFLYGDPSVRGNSKAVTTLEVNKEKASEKESELTELEDSSVRTSIQFYLNPSSEKSKQSYRQAVDNLLSQQDRNDEIEVERKERNEMKGKLQTHFPLKVLREKYTSLKNSSDIYALHNAYTCYVLGVLIVATGHRVSRMPFYFPWDIQYSEKLAFICDKNIIGSEARFVPLCDAIIALLEQYRRYLFELHIKFKSSDGEIANSILCAMRGSEVLGDGTERRSLGYFFCFREGVGSGNRRPRLTTVSTARVAMEARRSNGPSGIESSRMVRSWRAQLANFLWESGLSEPHVRAQLGHNEKDHLFGPSSTWSVEAWAKRVRPMVEAYLRAQMYELVDPPLKLHERDIPMCLPNMMVSGLGGYERREHAKRMVKGRAAEIFKKVLPKSWTSHDQYIDVSEEDKKEIQKFVESIDISGPGNKAAVQKEINILLNNVKKSKNRIGQNFFVNLKIEAGPVEISFPRRIDIANKIRAKFPEWLAMHNLSYIEVQSKLVKLALSLIIYDGVIDPKILKRLLLSIVNKEVMITEQGLIVRSEVLLPAIRYETGVILDDHTAALAQGIWNSGIDGANTALIEDLFGQKINKCLPKLVNGISTEVDSLDALCKIFSAWWFVRLPGFLYAGASGYRPSPMPSQNTLDIHLGTKRLNPITKNTANNKTQFEHRVYPESKQKAAAKDAINELFSMARGVKGKTKKKSGTQRRRLDAGINSSLSPDLQYWISNQKIVQQLIEFTQYLLDVGGEKKERLRFNVINKYISEIKTSLIDFCWNKDISTFNLSELEDLYKQVKKDREGTTSDGSYQMRLFGEFLASQYEIQIPKVYGSSVRIRMRVRSELIGPKIINAAIQRVNNSTHIANKELRDAAVIHLGVAFGYGLRRDENYELMCRNFPIQNSLKLRLRNNEEMSGKTETGRRYLPTYFASAKIGESISKYIENVRSREGRGKLYGSHANHDENLSDTSLVNIGIEALRGVTGNFQIVEHSLRHSFCNRILLSNCPPIAEVPLATSLRASLINSEDEHWQTYIKNQPLPPEDWPFWIDRSEALMGHEGAFTLYWYWKGDFICMAEYAKHSTKDIQAEWSAEDLAHIVGLTSSAISQRMKVHKKNGALQSFSWKALVADLNKTHSKQENFHLHEYDIDECEYNHTTYTPINDPSSFHLKLVSRSKGLTTLEQILTLETAHSETNSLSLAKAIENYRAIVNTTGFDDFEPESNNIVVNRSSNYIGVASRSLTREEILVKAWELLKCSNTTIRSIAKSWSDKLDSKDPFWIMADAEEAQSSIDFLISIGFQPSEIGIFLSGVSIEEFMNKAPWCERDQCTYREKRLSFGPENVKKVEIGIGLKTKNPVARQYTRELHRVLMILNIFMMNEDVNVDVGD